MKKSSRFGIALLGSAALKAITVGSAVIVTAGISALPAAAQDFTNLNATGRVVDEAGKAIAGASVTVTSDTQGFSRTVTTDSSGRYLVSSLPQGSYSFSVTASGFSAYSESGIALTQSSAGNEFQLVAETAANANMITVTSRRVRVSDFDRTTTGAVISIGELATRIPVARDLTSVIQLAPGTSLGDTAFGNLAAISGSSVSENAFFVNGLNITEFREGLGSVQVPFEFFNTVEVKNGGVSAEFGRFTGGFINATTKSGGNEFHGGALVSFAPKFGYSTAPNTVGNFNQADEREQLSSVFYLSGPIIKDRLFFYGFYQANYNTQSDTSLAVNFGQLPAFSTGLRVTEQQTTSPFWGGKIDAIITDGHRLEFTYFDSKQVNNIFNSGVVDENGGPYDSRTDELALPGAAQGKRVNRFGGVNYVGRYTGQFTDWLTVSAAYGKNKNRSIAGSADDNYPSIADASGAFNPALTGNALTVIDVNQDTRTFYRGDVDLFFTALGNHHVKFGYDREELKSDASSVYTGGVSWTYNTAGAGDPYAPPGTLYVAGRTFVNGGLFTSLNEAAYIQDAWSLFNNRLTLNLGVRADRFSNNNVAGVTYYNSGKVFSPRLAASFDVFGNGQTKVYGSFGRYYLPIVANTNIRLAGAELDYTQYFRVAGVNPDNTPQLGAALLFDGAGVCQVSGVANCENISNGVATPTEATVGKNLKPQSVDEFQIGFEQNLGNRMRVGLFAQYRKLNESLEDVAIDAAVRKYCTAQSIAGCDDIWDGFHQYVLVNPGAASQITLSDPIGGETTLRTVDFSADDLGYPKAERTYKAVTVTFDRDFDGTWSLSGSYTLSESKGNIEGGIRSDNGQTDSGLTTAFDQPGLTDGTFGFLPGDARHRFKLYGSYRVFDWFTLGANVQAQSPRKFGCIGRVPASRDFFAGLYGAAGFYCNVRGGEVISDPAIPVTQADLTLTPRGSRFESDWQAVTNLSMAFQVPVNQVKAVFRIDVFNVLNSQAKIDFEERGTLGNGRPRPDYGQPLVYQTPRSIRFQLGVDF